MCDQTGDIRSGIGSQRKNKRMGHGGAIPSINAPFSKNDQNFDGNLCFDCYRRRVEKKEVGAENGKRVRCDLCQNDGANRASIAPPKEQGNHEFDDDREK